MQREIDRERERETERQRQRQGWTLIGRQTAKER